MKIEVKQPSFWLIYTGALIVAVIAIVLIVGKPAHAQSATPCPTCERVIKIDCGDGVTFPKVHILPGETSTLAKLRKCSNKAPVVCWNKQKKWGPANLSPDARAAKVCPPKKVSVACKKGGRKVWVPEQIALNTDALAGYLASACKRRAVVYRTKVVVRHVPKYVPARRPRPGDYGNARCRCK